MFTDVRTRAEWRVGEHDFVFELGEEDGELTTSAGSLVLSLAEWRALHIILGRQTAALKIPRSAPPDDRVEGTVERPAQQGARWSAEDDLQLARRWAEGATVEEIAIELQRNAGGIASRLVRLDIVEDRDAARQRSRPE